MNLLIAENNKKFEAHAIPKMLDLKIILHYGLDVGAAQIVHNIKFIGEDVIIANRLLKNSIKSNEYLMMSKSLIDEYKDRHIENEINCSSLKVESDTYNHAGNLSYRFIDLKPLKN